MRRKQGKCTGFSERLKQAMEAREVYSKQLARAIGHNAESVRRWLRGENEPCLADLARICELLRVDAGWLLGVKEGR